MNNKLSDLIAALTIFLKYGDVANPTNCLHDEMRVFPGSSEIAENDLKELERLGFTPDDDIQGAFLSRRFGSN